MTRVPIAAVLAEPGRDLHVVDAHGHSRHDRRGVLRAADLHPGDIVDGHYHGVLVHGLPTLQTDDAGLAELSRRAHLIAEAAGADLGAASGRQLRTHVTTHSDTWDTFCTAADTLASHPGGWEAARTRTTVTRAAQLRDATRSVHAIVTQRLSGKLATTVAAITVGAVVTVAGMLAAHAVGHDSPVVSASTRPAACALPGPDTPEALTRMFLSTDTSVFAGGDGMVTQALPDGRTLLLTSDTFTRPPGEPAVIASGSRMVHNTALVIDGGCVTSATGGGELFASRTDAAGRPIYQWPTSIVANPDGTATVFTSTMTTTPGGAVNSFDFRRTAVSRYTIAVTGDRVTSLGGEELPADPQGITWGAGAGRDRDGTYVIYGTREVPGQFGREVFVATTTDARSDPSTWRKAGRGTWARADATPITTDASTSVSAVPSAPWTFLTKRYDMVGTDVTATAVNPATGQAATTVTIARAPSTARALAYDPRAVQLTPTGPTMVLVNHNSVQPGEHSRAAFSPSGVTLTAAIPGVARLRPTPQR